MSKPAPPRKVPKLHLQIRSRTQLVHVDCTIPMKAIAMISLPPFNSTIYHVHSALSTVSAVPEALSCDGQVGTGQMQAQSNITSPTQPPPPARCRCLSAIVHQLSLQQSSKLTASQCRQTLASLCPWWSSLRPRGRRNHGTCLDYASSDKDPQRR